MVKSLDETVSKLPPLFRALVAAASIASVAFAAGMVVASRGIADEQERLASALASLSEQVIQADAALRADIATNRSNVAALTSIMEQTDLRNMARKIGRIDRELCLARADLAGTITPQMQQECASR